MGENSKIEWTDHTFNPWMGCTKVAAGCANCYAERDMDKHYHKVQWGPHGTRVKTSDANWRKPLKWNREAEANYLAWDQLRNAVHRYAPARPRVFCASLADVFEDWEQEIRHSDGSIVHRCEKCHHETGFDSLYPYGMPCNCWGVYRATTMNTLRADLFALIDATPWLDWLLLTKRPENISRMWCSHVNTDGLPPSKLFRRNVWLLTSVAEQGDADRNVPELLKCRDLVPVLGVSAEPLVGPVDLTHWWPDGVGNEVPPTIDWVIAGGESGPNARPMHPDWARSLRDQCQAADVAFHFKQWGEWAPCEFGAGERHDPPPSELSHYFDSPPYKVWRFGKKAAGRLLDGREWNEYPVLQSTEH